MGYWEILILRYQKPLYSLADDWLTKGLIALGASIWAIVADMFVTQAELVFLLSIVITLDLITGLVASRRTNVPVTSMGLRQSVVKVGEYIIVLGLVVAITNTFDGDIPYISHLDTWAFLYAIVTEFKSVVENITKGRESRVRELWTYIIEKLMKELKRNK